MHSLKREQFMATLILRNRGLIADEDQRRLTDARFLIAGCGSVGGAAVEPLVRAGALKLVLAEPGCYELLNLNRQRASVSAIGRNKADWLAEQARAINPFVEIKVHREGITAGNAEALTADADLIVDGVDVTTTEGLAAKLALHDSACAAGRPVVSGFDLAYRQYVRVYDYRRHPRALGGKANSIRRARDPVAALAKMLPVWSIPCDLVNEIERLLDQPGASVGQLGCAADLFGALVVPLSLELLADRSVRPSFTIDLKDAALPLGRRLLRRCSALAGMVRVQLRLWRRGS